MTYNRHEHARHSRGPVRSDMVDLQRLPVYEGELFENLLRELCDTVPQPPQATGRPRLPLSDMIYGLGLKVYSTRSTRQGNVRN